MKTLVVSLFLFILSSANADEKLIHCGVWEKGKIIFGINFRPGRSELPKLFKTHGGKVYGIGLTSSRSSVSSSVVLFEYPDGPTEKAVLVHKFRTRALSERDEPGIALTSGDVISRVRCQMINLVKPKVRKDFRLRDPEQDPHFG